MAHIERIVKALKTGSSSSSTLCLCFIRSPWVALLFYLFLSLVFVVFVMVVVLCFFVCLFVVVLCFCLFVLFFFFGGGFSVWGLGLIVGLLFYCFCLFVCCFVVYVVYLFVLFCFQLQQPIALPIFISMYSIFVCLNDDQGLYSV